MAVIRDEEHGGDRKGQAHATAAPTNINLIHLLRYSPAICHLHRGRSPNWRA